MAGRPVDLTGWDVGDVKASIVHSFSAEIREYVLEHGLSSFYDELVLEGLVAKGASAPTIVKAFVAYLSKAVVDTELIIVDPYFYHPIDPAYALLVEQIISPFLSTLTDIRVVTKPNKVTPATKAAIDAALKVTNPALNIHHTTTHDFHDRFWITNKREKGVIAGGSLSTYGASYCLVDRLNTSDVRMIVAELVAASLI